MLNIQDFAQFRTKSLGGSDIGAILGLSRFKTPVDVWLEKTGQVQDQASSLPLRFGQYAEDFIAQEYSLQTQQTLAHHEAAFTHSKYTFLTGHIDRFILTGDQPLFNTEGKLQAQKILECKTANPFSQHEWGDSPPTAGSIKPSKNQHQQIQLER